MRLTAVALAIAATLGFTAPAPRPYPDRPLTLIVPFAIGGPTDTMARLIAEAMGQALHQPVLVENMGGAGGTRGAAQVAKAPPDGYTLLLNNLSQATAATLYRHLPYDPATGFETVGLVATVPMTLVARRDLPPTTLPELRARLKARPERITLGTAGLGSASYLCGLLLSAELTTPVTFVPYPGTGPAISDLISGQLDLMCDQTTNTAGPIAAGTVKAYGVTTAARLAALPGLPTLQENGFKDFELAVWHGLYVPKGTPKARVERLNAALSAALDDPRVGVRLAELGATPEPQERRSPAFHRQFLSREIARWQQLIPTAGVPAE